MEYICEMPFFVYKCFTNTPEIDVKVILVNLVEFIDVTGVLLAGDL